MSGTSPARQLAAALGILAAVVALFFWPLFRGETFVDVASRQNELYPWAGSHVDRPPTLHYDQSDQYYPWQVFISRALRSGEIPLWNPYSFGGAPFESNGQNGIFYPPRTVLSLLVAPERVHDFLIVSHMLLGGLLMYLLLRSVRLGFLSAVFGAIAWMLNSFMLAWMGLTHYVVIEAWLPLAILLLIRLFRYRSWLDGVWLGVVLALIFLGGHIMYVLISITACGALAAYLALRHAWRELDQHPPAVAVGRAVRTNLIILIPFLVMGGLIAVQLLPMLDLGRESARTALPFDQFVSSYYRIEPGQLLYFFLPPPPGLTRERLHIDAGWLFMGTPTALLALLGLLRRHPLATFARWLALAVLLIALGTLATWCVYYGLPGFKYFKPVSRVLFLFQFGVAILAAFGLDYLLRRAPSLPRWRWWGACPPRWRGLAAYAALAIVVVQMFHLGSALVRHQAATPDYLYPATPLTEALGHDDSTRILPVIPDRDVQPDHPIGRFFYGSTAMVFPLQSALGYDNPPDRIANLWRVVHGNSPERVLGPPTELDLLRPPDDKAQRIWAFVPTFRVPDVRFDLLPRVGVTDVVTPPYVERDPAWEPDRFGPARLELQYSGGDGRIYHVANALPRAYLVPECVQPDSQLAVLEQFADPAWDPRRAVLLDPHLAPAGVVCAQAADVGAVGAVGDAAVVRRSLNDLDLQVHADAPAWLVVNESWDGGWVANIDGETTQVYPGNYAFRALQVPAGDHTVALNYQPASFRRGAAASGIALAFVLSVTAWVLARRLRRGGVRLGARTGQWWPAPAPRRPAFRLALARLGTGTASAVRQHRAALGYVLLVLGIAAYHQYVGARSAVAYFAGETGRTLDMAESLAVNLRPDWTTLATSSNPAAVALYSFLLRAFDIAFERPDTRVLQPSVGPLAAALALLATVVCVLAALLALRCTGSRAVAAITTVLVGLYPPLVLTSERGVSELPLLIFLLGALICAREAFERRSPGYGVAAGALFALMVGTHLDWLVGLTAVALLALGGAMVILLARRRGALRVGGAIAFTGVGCLAVWAAVIAALPVEQRPAGLDSATGRRSLFALSLTDGWLPDTWYTLQVDDAATASAHAAVALLRGEFPCHSSEHWRTALACASLQPPLTTIAQFTTQQVRLWWSPYQPPAVEVDALGALTVGYHRLLLLTGLVGCVLLVRRRPLAGTLLLLPVAFVAVRYASEVADARAALPAIPSLAIGAAALLPGARAALAVSQQATVALARGAVACALVGVVLTLSLDIGATGRPEPWSVRLEQPRQQLIQEIDRADAPKPEERLAILIDLQADDGDLSGLRVTLNGHPVPTTTDTGGLVFPTIAAISGEDYRTRYEQNPRGWRDVLRRPQWVALPVPSDWVSSGRNEVRVGLDAEPAPGAITVFGETVATGEPLRLPTLFMTSVARFDQEGDPRVPAGITVTSRGRGAWYSPDGGFSLLDDLSPDTGFQGGTYHILLGVLAAEPFPDALSDRELRARSITTRMDSASDPSAVDSFWLLASSVGRSRVTVFDRGRALVAFEASGDTPAQWISTTAQVAYQPYDPADPPFPRTTFQIAEGTYEMTPVEAAVALWYTRPPGDQVPRPAELPRASSGVYVVRLSEPVALQDLTVSASPIGDRRPVSWGAFRGWSAAAAAAAQPVVLALRADGSAQYLGALSEPTGVSPTEPTLFIMHGGDLSPAATIQAAAARLDLRRQPAGLVPTSSSLNFPAVKTADGGTFSSYWAAVEQPGLIELPPVMVRLE